MENNFIGIDFGNGTFKMVLMDENRELIKSVYAPNRNIIDSLKEGLKKIKKANARIAGCGITGVARNLISMLIGADVKKTEVSAHYKGASYYYPNARTILEIGYQDSKILTLDDGIINNFSMNTVCSAGTGQFLVNLAERMNISIEDFAGYALKGQNPINISGKCAVFAASSCLSKLSEGVAKEDILMGAVRSLIRNYLAIVGKNVELKPDFIFQGGVSQNKAVVKALEEELGHKTIVPEYAPLMGAIGMAFYAMDVKKTRFKGFDVMDIESSTDTFECDKCENGCTITKVIQDNKVIGHLGSKCGRW